MTVNGQVKSALESLSVEGTVENCPAFANKDGKEACPFGALAKEGEKHESLKKCPAFQKVEQSNKTALTEVPSIGGGDTKCPFRECQSMSQVWEKMESVPASHRATTNTEAKKVITEIITQVHSISQEMKSDLGECPKFSTQCPFKSANEEDKNAPNGPIIDPVLFGIRMKRAESSVLEESDSPPPANGISLRKMLKEETRDVHREAENVEFVKTFIKGKVKADVYRELVARLYHVYKVLEAEWDTICQDDSRQDYAAQTLRKVWFPETLSRTASIEEDLKYYCGENWRLHHSVKTPSPATAFYCNRIRKLAAERPELLVAHAYTRYLGDLSGGQTLKRVACKAMQLPETGEGVAFYIFPKIESAKDFKNMYRARLDSIEPSAELAADIVEEAIEAFRCNVGLFHEMDTLLGVPFKHPLISQLGKKQSSGCPFARLAATANETIEAPAHVAHSHHPSKPSFQLSIIAGAFFLALALLYTRFSA